MDLPNYMRLLRKRWRLIVACLLLGAGAAAAISWTATPKYEASTQLFVSARDAASDLNGLAQGGQFTQERVQSYADIVNSPEVTEAVADELDHGLTPESIADEISASAPLNTVLINIDVTDTSPSRAQKIANAVSDEFALFINELETPIGSSTSPVKVSVVKRAELPTSPVSPRKPLNLALGVLIGLAVGNGAAFLRETLDTTVKDSDQIQRDLGLARLGAIAYDADARKRPLIVHADPHSSRSEAFRQLRTNLQFVDIDRAPRSIVITSSIPNEGKTTTATNLAIALAQTGMRVLLVEADLRRPRIAEYLGIEGAVGLTSILIGRARLADAVQTWGKDVHLNVLPSGPTPPNPSELLGSHGMAELIRELELTHDLVIVDAPPLLPVTDAAVLSTAVSGVLMVVRHGHTKRDQLARAVESLRAVEAAVYGAVLTMTPAKGPESYYYGYRPDTRREAKRRGKQDLVAPGTSTLRPTSGDRVPTQNPVSNGVRPIDAPQARERSGDSRTFFER